MKTFIFVHKNQNFEKWHNQFSVIGEFLIVLNNFLGKAFLPEQFPEVLILQIHRFNNENNKTVKIIGSIKLPYCTGDDHITKKCKQCSLDSKPKICIKGDKTNLF